MLRFDGSPVLVVYFTFFVTIAPTGRIIWRLREKDGRSLPEEEVTSLSHDCTPPNGWGD